MALSPGTRLGPYEILSAIGAGGMGEVYRARDPRIGREVAIKVLPAAFSENAERLRRFQQEAHSTGVLNHPNILAVHDVGTDNGAPYIVSELLEGETLREKLRNGPLSVRKTMDYAMQMAHGLAAAHEKGITHRDLKPENLFVTKDGRVKILDFGLAKLTEKTASDPQESSTLQTVAAESNPGTVLGTVGYMSPEQVRGLLVDWRSDIFSFGAILYEMFTGKRAFAGHTQADAISAILQKDPPDLVQSNPEAPPAAERIVRHCLEKDAARRFQSAQDVAFALEAISGLSEPGGIRTATLAPESAITVSRPKFWIMIGAACAIVAITTWFTASKNRVQIPTGVLQLSILPPAGTILTGWPVVSPDGHHVVFPATDSAGRVYLWLRSLSVSESQQLPGTEDSEQPFWSPDSKWVAFFASGKLKKVQLPTGPTQVLCDAYDPRGGTWNQEGTILFSPNPDQGLYRIPSSGGNVTPVTQLVKGEHSHRWPAFLPNGRNFLFYAMQGVDSTEREGIYFASLDSSAKKQIGGTVTGGIYIQPGYLLFQQNGTLMAQTYDGKENLLKGDPMQLTDQLTINLNLTGGFGFSASTDVIACLRGNQNSRLVWYDRSGRQVGTLGDPAMYLSVSLSHDGKRIVADIQPSISSIASEELWVLDSLNGNRSRLTFGSSSNSQPIWSPDGTKIAYSSYNSKGSFNLYLKDVSGNGKEQQLTSKEDWADDWSLDGRFILYHESNPKTNSDLWVLPLSEKGKAFPLMNSAYSETEGKFSPDGQYVVYKSNETGRPEIYVQTFPDASRGKWQISTGGGAMPAWSRDGKELFYLTLDRKMMSVDTSKGFQSVSSKTLFALANLPFRFATNDAPAYAVSDDAQRFLMIAPVEDPARASITIISNWQELLKK